MRATTVIVMGLVIGLAAPAFAQSALEGPLAAPGVATAPADSNTPAKPAAAVKPKHRKPVKSAQRHATPPADAMNYGAGIPAPAQPARTRSLPSALDATSNPVDFGMKWNGNADSARETRVQNYNGDAQGTGAEVGMKLHF